MSTTAAGRVLAICTLCGCLLLRAAVLLAQQTPLESGHACLLLTNKSVLQGQVTRLDKYYKVTLPHGELQIRCEQVDCCCESLHEVYQKLHARRIDNTLQGYADLARWCIQNQLFEEAATELGEANVFAPQSQVVAMLRVQLQQQKLLAETPPQAVHEETGSTFQTAGYAESAPKPTPASPSAELPGWAKAEFVKRVQPMLLHTCATGGCHTPTANQSWTIDRAALDGVGSPELIEANLNSVLRFADPAEPQRSVLLSQGKTPHGSPARLSEKLRPRQQAILEAWLEQLALERTEGAGTIGARSLTSTQPNGVDAGSTPAANGELRAVRTPPAATDPFDPAAFNRQNAPPEEGEVTPPPEVPPNSQQEQARE